MTDRPETPMQATLGGTYLNMLDLDRYKAFFLEFYKNDSAEGRRITVIRQLFNVPNRNRIFVSYNNFIGSVICTNMAGIITEWLFVDPTWEIAEKYSHIHSMSAGIRRRLENDSIYQIVWANDAKGFLYSYDGYL